MLLTELKADLQTKDQEGSLPAFNKQPAVNPWHALLATWLGGVFDGMDSSIFAIVLFPALSELLQTNNHASIGVHGSYVIALFMLGWALGAIFFGSLADKIGRTKTLTLTILLYAFCTGLCACAHSWWELGIYRFLVGAGIGGEMGVGAVLLSECWPNKSRLYAVGAMATSLGFGYLLTALLNLVLGPYGWRWLFVAGIAPAFLTVYIRTKLKESAHFESVQERRNHILAKADYERTEQEQKLLSGGVADLFNKANFRKTLIVSMLTSSAIIGWWSVLAWIPAWINQITGLLAINERSSVMFCKDFGMILSGILGSWMIVKLGYRKTMGLSFILALFTTVSMFLSIKGFTPAIFAWVTAVGFFAHVPFVLLWAYIPELYETRIRSTAFGVTYNIGRILAAFCALGSGELIRSFSGNYALAAACLASIYLVGFAVSFVMPEAGGTLDEAGA